MSTALSKRAPSADLAKSKEVPDIAKNTITSDDWDAMPYDERVAAIEFFRAEMETTTEGLSITFPRIKYPTSGAGVFEIPGAQSPEYVPTITAVVVHKQVVRAYWPVGDPIANNPPTCSSPDGITPLNGPGKQAEQCVSCKHAQFGSGKDDSGQACKQRVNTFLLRDQRGLLEEIPTLLSFPPTAIKPLGEFTVQVRKANLTLLSQCTEIGLTDARNKAGIAYKGVTLKLGRKLSYEEMRSARAIATAFASQMQQRGFVPEAEVEEGKGALPAHGAQGTAEREQPVIIDSKAEKVPF
jgi:hypothetical protein